MKFYKGIMVGKGSQLYDALERNDQDAAKKIYVETTANFNKQVPNEADRAWLYNESKS